MPMRALLAVDLHEDATGPIAHAVAWATHMSATIDLITASEMVWDAHHLFGGTENAALAAEWERRTRKMEKLLAHRLEEIPEPMRGEARVVHGRAAPTLIEASADYDLLILATHGRKGLQRLFAGSVAERVVRRAACPVLITRLDGDAISPDGNLKIVLPVDSEEPIDKAVQWAKSHLGGRNDFRVMCAVPIMPTAADQLYAEWPRQRLDTVALSGGMADIPREVRGCTGNAGDEIARYATEIGASLIAMPTHTRQALGRLAFGSVTERVVRVAPCAVLVVR